VAAGLRRQRHADDLKSPLDLCKSTNAASFSGGLGQESAPLTLNAFVLQNTKVRLYSGVLFVFAIVN